MGNVMGVTIGCDSLPFVTAAISFGVQIMKFLSTYGLLALITIGLSTVNVYLFSFIRERLRPGKGLLNSTPVFLVLLFSLFISLFFVNGLDRWVDRSIAYLPHLLEIFLWIAGSSCVAILLRSNYQLSQQRQKESFRAEKFQRLRMEAELAALKQQIDPHFLFNSLNTMSFLIESEPAKAKLFNDTLGNVYRYILLNRDKNLILLKEELEFISNYFYLLSIRHPEGLELSMELNAAVNDNSLVPPVSLQILIENAIKHNSFTKEHPLQIKILVNDGYVSVCNNIRKLAYLPRSSKTGLKNLAHRYEFITQKKIVFQNNTDTFTVKLPLVND